MATPPTLAPEIVIAVRDVCTRFGDAVIQDGVTLEVPRGKIFALAGPSGCGKSLLLRQALALQLPDSGSIRVLGRDVVGLRDEEALALRRRCGVVFERAALFSSLTVAENVALPLRERTRLRRPLLDEPSAGLDPESSWAFEELIRNLNELLGLTIFVVTRDPGLLWNAADHVAFLGPGRVIAAGTIEEVSRSDEPV